jgi:transaldolase
MGKKMEFFIDTADIAEIKKLYETGLVDGVTTNPTLVAKESGKDFFALIREIAALVKGPVSAEVAATDFDTMLEEGRKLAKISKNIAVKVPLTEAGLKVCKILTDEGKKVNVTLCFTPGQALLAAKAGATYISPFIGRLDDTGEDGMQVIRDIVQIYRNYPDLKTKVLAASIRSVAHVVEAAKAGADVATVPPKIIYELFKHPLTDKGIAAFVADWQKTGQSIL